MVANAAMPFLSPKRNPLESGYFLVDILRMCENDDIKDVYAEAKGTGFDTKILKKVIALRKKDEQERLEEEAILETYLAALGMIEGPPDAE